ncbi:MAG: chorismate transformation enzyme, FkbO/Hyg5 family [Acidithiobacillus ferrivorans]
MGRIQKTKGKHQDLTMRLDDVMTTGTDTPLTLTYAPAAVALNNDALRTENILGIVLFDSPLSAGIGADQNSGILKTPLSIYGSDVCEIWSTTQSVIPGHYLDIRYRRSATLTFGSITLAITSPPDDGDNFSPPPLQLCAQEAYHQIFTLLQESGHLHLLRVWNFLPDINGATHGLEHYRQFNIGRASSFITHNRLSEESSIPAASAVGTSSANLVVHFLAGQHKSVALENPRQISAYCYPKKYGPCSPTFSRGGWLKLDQQHALFISGTASIVGHDTLHIGDVAAQTQESIRNISAVIDEANHVAGHHLYALNTLTYRVYFRNIADLTIIQSELNRLIAPATKMLYIQADICRAELLVEIEATGGVAQS